MIRDWPIPKTAIKVQSFYGLAIFYCRTIRNFNSLAALMTDWMKKDLFQWSEEADQAFALIKEKLTIVPILAMHDCSGQNLPSSRVDMCLRNKVSF